MNIFAGNNLDAFFLPSTDEFLGEYAMEGANRLLEATGFTGSNGFAVVLRKGQGLFFTDGRYALQARMELGEGRFEILDISKLEAELANRLKGLKIGFNPRLHPFGFVKRLREKGLELVEVHSEPFKVSGGHYDFKMAGSSKEEKLQKIRQHLGERQADALFIFDPHDAAWVFNIRGDSLKYTPVFNTFAVVSREASKFISLDEVADLKFESIIVPRNISYYFYNQLSKSCARVIVEDSPFLARLRAVKTPDEIEAIRKAHAEDSRALGEFLAWARKAKGETEYTMGLKLAEFRAFSPAYKGESFAAIVGFRENGAIIHYHASLASAKKIEGDGLLLVDSGGQYYDPESGICGTTDITRVIALGTPTEEQRHVYTLVLKGHIALATAIVPRETIGSQLDILARQFLYAEGRDYKHGTGHGVGFFLSVHEWGGVSKTANMPLQPGMVISNEPGYYKEGEFGIRIENLMVVKDSAHEGFLEFETLTKVPLEKTLIDFEMLTSAELAWLEANGA